ncbi:MAG: hypothetical protein HQL98_15505 [Magnetococcales bacterium]|nr:hypothetical protein [Magnetococcales bacterium]
MSLKPAPVEAQLRVQIPRGYQGVWEIFRKLPDHAGLTVGDVCSFTNSNRTTVERYMRALERAGYLKRFPVRLKEIGAYVYRRTGPFGLVAVRLRADGTPVGEMGRGQENMWRTLKMLKTFSPLEVAVHASTDAVQVSEGAARTYLARLAWAGYLKRERGGSGRYRFLPSGDTGPLAPMIMRTKFVFDPNVNAVRGPGSDAHQVTT